MRKYFYIAVFLIYIPLSHVSSIPGPSIRAGKDGMFTISVDSLLSAIGVSDSLSDKVISEIRARHNELRPNEQLKYYQILGNYFYNREDPDSSIFYFSKGLDVARRMENAYYMAYFHLWNAINYNIKSEYETALNELNIAAITADVTDSIRLQNTIARNTGNVYWGMGIYEKALDQYFKSLRIGEANGYYRDIASSLNNIGNVYQAINDFVKARDYYTRAYEMAAKNNFRLVAAITSNNIGDLLLVQKKYDSALIYFNRSLQISTELKSRFYQGIALYNIGNIYLQNDSVQKADGYLYKSLEKAIEAGDRLGVAECYLKLGELFLKESKPHKAEPFLDSGMLMARQIGSLQLLDLANELKTEYFTQMSDFTSAYESLETRLALKDSIFNQESGESIAKLEARYREEKRDQQIADLRREKINSRNIYLLGTLSLIVILILIFIGLRTSRRKNAILSMQNAEIEKQRLLLIQKNAELVRSQTELEKINRGKDQFLTIISHDLRNPVSATRGFVELLINRFDHLTDDDKKRFLQEVFDSVERISLLISNVLFWVRSQISGIKIQPVKFDLHKRINDNFSLYKIIAKGKGVSLINEVPDEFIMNGDTNIYDTIFRNLISNSLKFTEAGGLIKVKAEKTDGKTVISVTDTGIGFDQTKTGDILNSDIHYSTTGTHHEKGTGLGLSLINEFAHHLNAGLEIKSKPGKGTTVVLTTD